MPVTCHDPRHSTPCEDCENCTACMEECYTKFWVNEDGTKWEDDSFVISEQGSNDIGTHLERGTDIR